MKNLRSRRTADGDWVLTHSVDTGMWWDSVVFAKWDVTLRQWIPLIDTFPASHPDLKDVVKEINSRAHDPYKLCYNCMGLGVVDARNKTQSGTYYREVICPTCQGQCVKLPFSQQAELEL